MSRVHTILIGVAVLFFTLIIALLAGVSSLVLIERVDKGADKNRESIEEINKLTDELLRLRSESNKAICVSTNVTRASTREAIKDSLLELVPDDTPLTADQEARINVYNQSVDSHLPFRDCSEEGIEAFLANRQPDPALVVFSED